MTTTDPEATTAPIENAEPDGPQAGDDALTDDSPAMRGTGSGGVPDKPIRSDGATRSDR